MQILFQALSLQNGDEPAAEAKEEEKKEGEASEASQALNECTPTIFGNDVVLCGEEQKVVIVDKEICDVVLYAVKFCFNGYCQRSQLGEVANPIN